MTSSAAFAIKAEITDPLAKTFAFASQKTMYGGKRIAAGDKVYLFTSRGSNESGLIARGVVTLAEAIEKHPDLARQTPRVSVAVEQTGLAKRWLGRNTLKHHLDWNDGRPETELNFKLYRQTTDKIVGVSNSTELFLESFFD